MSENPYAKYAQPQQPKPENPYAKYRAQPQVVPEAAPERKTFNDQARELAAPIMEGPVGQVGAGALETLSALPGAPLDAVAGVTNFLKRQVGEPEVPLSQTPLKDWGAQGFAAAARKPINVEAANRAIMPPGMLRIAEMIARNQFAGGGLGVPEMPEPVGEAQRIARKGGNIAGGALFFGPAAMVPAATATAGSEIGRVADQMVPEVTKGYGEAAGGVIGGAAPSVTSMLRRPVDTSRAPSNQSLRSQADAAYQRADDAGIIIKPEALQRMNAEIERELTEFGYHPTNQPGTATALSELQKAAASGNITLKGVDVIRRIAKNAPNATNRADLKATQKVVKNIDRMLSRLTPDDVLAGDARKGVAALNEARTLWSRLSKSELIDEALDKATRQAQRAGSGGNIDNAIRQKIDAIINSPSKSRGFTPDELALMRRVVSGRSVTQELLRLTGKLSPQGNGLMLMLSGLGGGAALTGGVNPAVMALPLAGAIAKPIANAMTRGNARMLSQAVRRGNAFQPRRMLTRASAAPAALNAPQRP